MISGGKRSKLEKWQYKIMRMFDFGYYEIKDWRKKFYIQARNASV